MAYYGMNSFTCHAMHFGKWLPYDGQYWCPICDTLRIGNPMKAARLITRAAVKKVLKETDDG